MHVSPPPIASPGKILQVIAWTHRTGRGSSSNFPFLRDSQQVAQMLLEHGPLTPSFNLKAYPSGAGRNRTGK